MIEVISNCAIQMAKGNSEQRHRYTRTISLILSPPASPSWQYYMNNRELKTQRQAQGRIARRFEKDAKH